MNTLSRRFKLLFGLGDLTVSMPLAILAFYQLFFLINVAGLRPAWAGTAILIGRMWDGINDPIFGTISDRLSSPKGRRRVLLYYAAVPMGISFILLMIVPPFGELGLLIYYSLAIIAFDTIFTMINVGHNALTAACTSDYDEQSSLNGYRMVYQIVGSLFGVILALVIAEIIPDQRTYYAVLGLIIGLLSILPILVVYRITEPFKSNAKIEEELPPLEAIKMTVNNRPFLMLMGLYLFSWTTAVLIGSTLIFYANYYLRVPDQANYFIVVSQTSGIVFMPLMVWVATKVGKRKAFIGGCVWWILVTVGIAFAGQDQATFVYILAVLGGPGIATAYFLPWAMIPDVVAVDQLKTGLRREGSFYSFAAFFQKLGTGLVAWVFGLALGAAGYITPENANDLPVQPESAIQAIRLAMGAVPTVLLVLAIICAYFYPITRQSHEDVQRQLDARAAGG